MMFLLGWIIFQSVSNCIILSCGHPDYYDTAGLVRPCHWGEKMAAGLCQPIILMSNDGGTKKEFEKT
jgi:hypothetical protein